MSASTLALLDHDATPAVPATLLRHWPQHDRHDFAAVRRAMSRTPRDPAGPGSRLVADFEQAVADYHGVGHTVAVASDADALWAALVARGIGPGHRVIVSELARAAAMAVVAAGAEPVFCDVNPDTGGIEHFLIEELIDEQTVAIVVSHTHGLPADLNSIVEIADLHNLVMIQDATQALGARYFDRPVAAYADVAVVSADADSPLAAGGALVVTDDDQLATAIRTATNGGMPRIRPDDGQVAANWVRFFGRESAMSPRDAALGLARLERLDETIARAEHNAGILHRGLDPVHGVRLPFVHPARRSTHHELTLRLVAKDLDWHGPIHELRDRFILALHAEGVPVDVVAWAPVSRMPIFRVAEPWRVRDVDASARPMAVWDSSRCPTAQRRIDETIVLGRPPHPLHAQSQRFVERCVIAIEKVVNNAPALLTARLGPLEPVPPIPIHDL
jgi:perosamine synthetase